MEKLQAVGIIVAVLAASLAIEYLSHREDSSLAGDLRLGPLGTIAEGSCQSGERELFHGVWIRAAANGPVVKLVKDPLAGWQVLMQPRGCQSGAGDTSSRVCEPLRLGSKDCAKLVVTIDRHGTDQDPLRSGKALLDCKSDDGEARGAMTFRNCAF